MKLKRELNLLDVFCIASGVMISSGLFILPGLAYARAGPAVVFSYILAGILVIPAMLSAAELATAMPKAGGVYFFIERSMGSHVGTVGGIASWLSLSSKSAFALLGMGIFAVLLYPEITIFQIKLIAVGCCLFFMLINLVGVKAAGRFQVYLVFFLLGLLTLYVLGGTPFIQHQRYIPFLPSGFASVFAVAGLVFISFGGLTKICSVAEEIKNPGRNIPLGMFLAFGIVMLFYVAVVFVTVGLVESQKLSNSFIPISLAAGSFMGGSGIIIMAIAALLAFISTANAGILSASRDAMAMSRDGLLPDFFGKVNAKFRTPHFSIILTTAFMIAVILFLSFENLVKTASTLHILLFAFVNLSLIIMRESKIQNYRPKFHSPLYPWIQIFGIVGYGFLIFEMGKIPLSIAGSFVGLALIWYLVYAGIRVERRSALMHIIERVTAKDLPDATLPKELKEILIERDDIVEDRFHRLIKDCEILDYDPPATQKCTVEDVFKMVMPIFSRRLEIDEKRLFNLFMERERQSSTVIAPGHAVPHIIIEEKGKFEIILVRARKGIIFPDTRQPVHVLFAIVSSADERNFYLRALAAIAQIIQDHHFERRWMAAKSKEALRDILLLGERRREKWEG